MKTTLISLVSLFIFIFAISINSPASVNTSFAEDIVIVDDSTSITKSKADCDKTGPKSKCVTAKKDCSAKCTDPHPKKCCSKHPAKKCCGPKK